MYRTLSQKLEKTKNIIKIFVSVGVIFALTIVFVLIFSNRSSPFDSLEFYFVYTDYSEKPSELENKAQGLKQLGGAGVVQNFNEKYYLVLCVYSEKEDAEEVRENILNRYKDSGVLQVKRKKIKGSIKREIKQNEKLYSCFKIVSGIATEAIAISMEYLSGKIAADRVITKFLDIKLNLDEVSRETGTNSVLFEKILREALVERALIENFLNTFYQASKKNSIVLSLASNLVKSSIELVNNL